MASVRFLIEVVGIIFLYYVPSGSAYKLDEKILKPNLILRNINIEDSSCTTEKWADTVELRLYTRNFPSVPVVITSQQNYDQVELNENVTTTVIVHGYLTSGLTDWVIKMKDKYLEKTNHNVIVVDWSRYSLTFAYNDVVANVGQVGVCLAKALTDLLKSKNQSTDNVHLVGHSLGAHISGFLGRTIQNQSGSSVGRITALDATGIFFATEHSSEALDKSDAQFVDAIHTNGGVFGLYRDFGHADFYPNGGFGSQPACGLFKFECSHSIVIDYYMESIDSDQFIGKKCGSYIDYEEGKCDGNEAETMGLGLSTKARGAFYLNTNLKAPYARGNQKI